MSLWAKKPLNVERSDIPETNAVHVIGDYGVFQKILSQTMYIVQKNGYRIITIQYASTASEYSALIFCEKVNGNRVIWEVIDEINNLKH